MDDGQHAITKAHIEIFFIPLHTHRKLELDVQGCTAELTTAYNMDQEYRIKGG